MARLAGARHGAQSSPDDGTAGKLALLEFLAGCTDAEAAADRVLGWFAGETRVRRALCAVVETERGRLVAIAGHGIRPRDLQRFSVDLDDRDHPAAAAMARVAPTVLGDADAGHRRASLAPFGAGPWGAVPLGDGGTSAGLLLFAPASPPALRAARWLARVFGPSLVRLQTRRVLAAAERRFRHERAQLYAIINAVPDPILYTDRDGRMILANARAEMLFASREDESEGRRRAVALNNMLFSAALSGSAFDDTEAFRHELPLVDPEEGSDLLFELLSTVIKEGPETDGVVSILRNVTDLRVATEELQENYQKLRLAEAEARAERDRLDLIIDSVADPILVTDPAGNLVMMNAPAERLFTAPLDVTSDVLARFRSNDAHFTSFISNLFLSGAELRHRGGISLVDPETGASIPNEAISGKILSDHGEVIVVVTILHDRTEEVEKARLYDEIARASAELEQKVREATAELARQNELLRRQHIELAQASALKTQFLANMSHEFRTPLNAILGYTSMLLQGVSGELPPAPRRSLARVDANARHLLGLINDILDIARIEAGKMPVTLSEFKLDDVIGEVMTEVEPLIDRSELDVTTELASGIPAVRSDRQKVKQIVLNLLTNALKFTPQGWVRICTRYDAETNRVAIAVGDSGIGIAPDDQSRIFEDFRQADASPTREYGGAGLGLSICRRLAGMLDGQIALESALGRGSTFTLVLPLRLRRR
jgi:signal transduction histidine kinase